jgi:predicted dehydrogenase
MLAFVLLFVVMCSQCLGAEPVRIGVAGLVMLHADGFLRGATKRSDVNVVGIYEPDAAVRHKFAERYKLPDSIFFTDLAAMLERTKPEAVAVFTSSYDHLMVAEVCAAHRIGVITMEKPLAVTMEHARGIQAAANRSHMQVIVNYIPTWYPTMRATWDLFKAQHAAGDIRKMVALDGIPGPKKLTFPPEFVEWVTDPVQAGGGALFDFACLGANLMTWLMDNRRPTSVTALIQQFQPQLYPHVDDEATLLLEYPTAQGIIQASWNWPFGRKDFEVYGETGYALATGETSLRVRLPNKPEESRTAAELPSDERDLTSYLVAVTRGRLKASGPSSLENGMIVQEILEAARQSAKSGKRIVLNGGSSAGPGR